MVEPPLTHAVHTCSDGNSAHMTHASSQEWFAAAHSLPPLSGFSGECDRGNFASYYERTDTYRDDGLTLAAFNSTIASIIIGCARDWNLLNIIH
jgi:hypothetical protein